jgi:hypothetical protein
VTSIVQRHIERAHPSFPSHRKPGHRSGLEPVCAFGRSSARDDDAELGRTEPEGWVIGPSARAETAEMADQGRRDHGRQPLG